MSYKTTCQCARCRLERENKQLKEQLASNEEKYEKRITELDALITRLEQTEKRKALQANLHWKAGHSFRGKQ